jgi:hypothetical protein
VDDATAKPQLLEAKQCMKDFECKLMSSNIKELHRSFDLNAIIRVQCSVGNNEEVRIYLSVTNTTSIHFCSLDIYVSRIRIFYV